MAQIETWFDQDLKKPVKVHHIPGNVFTQDNDGNLIGVRVFDQGEAATLSGSVSANVIRPDGGTVAVTGSLSGNQASVSLPQAAYAYPGMIAIVIKLTSGSTVTTLCAVTAIVYRSSTDTIIDPGTIIPDIQALIAAIDEAVDSIPPDYSELTGEVSDLKTAFNNDVLSESVLYNPFTKSNWSVGTISPTTGANATSAKAIKITSKFIEPAQGASFLKAQSGYKIWLFAYQPDGTYVGSWNGITFVKAWSYIPVVSFNLVKYSQYKYRVVISRDDEADMTTNEYTALNIYYYMVFNDAVRTKYKQNNLVDDTTIVRGYLTTSGDIESPSEQERRETTTDFIPVTPGKTYLVTGFVDNTVPFFVRVCFYDSTKTFLGRSDTEISTFTWKNFNAHTFSFTMSENVHYMRISCRHGIMFATEGITDWDYSVSAVDIRRHWSLRPKQDYFVRSINHRGYRRIAPENTAPAFELSADLGFWGVENDIRFTSDGVPVLLHDETINRTARNSDGTELSSLVYINSITYEQALTYDFGIWMGSEYAGTKIMTFEQFVALCRKKSLHMYNEIKAGTEAQIAQLVQTVKRYGMQKHCSWCSFSSSYLTKVCTYDANARIGLVTSTFDQTVLSSLIALKTATNTVFTIVSTAVEISNETIDALISNDIALEMYTPNFTSVVNNMPIYVTGAVSDWCIAGDILYTGVNKILVIE